jgi:hypothetical protein
MRGLVWDLFEITVLEHGEGDGDDVVHMLVEEETKVDQDARDRVYSVFGLASN